MYIYIYVYIFNIYRSIENAAKNPAAIDKWIHSISDLHRSKPPPQVYIYLHIYIYIYMHRSKFPLQVK